MNMNMKYSTKLLLANCIPILAFAIISLIIGFMQFRANLYDEKQGNLKSTALAAMALYSSHGYGDYGRKADGNVWRGMNFNISNETGIVDDLKKQTSVDVTFFFGERSEMTSIMNKDNMRNVETNAADYIRDYTLANGSQLWCRNIKINGKDCQAYVIPIRQDSDNAVVGALMTSQPADGFNKIIERYILTMLATALIILLAAFMFIRWYVERFSKEFYDATNKSKHDLLTGLFNKRSFEEETQAAIKSKKPNDVSVLLIFDFDNFKHVNDHYGHQIGDEVLKAFSTILGRAFRTKDIIGRIGGDEFMVFMPDMSEKFLKRSEEISSEILQALAALKVGPAGPFSCSIGIGTDSGNYDFQKLYKLADKALYESKERGKACYVRYSSDEVTI